MSWSELAELLKWAGVTDPWSVVLVVAVNLQLAAYRLEVRGFRWRLRRCERELRIPSPEVA